MTSVMAQAPIGQPGDEDFVFAVPKGRPPKAVKRGSLPDIGRVRVTRHGSQPKLAINGGSLSDLARVARERSGSLQASRSLTGSLRALSASNLAALSDSNLSIKEAVPHRSYEAKNTQDYVAKVHLEQKVKRYFYQLTEGCGSFHCQNKFCHNAKNSVQLSPCLAIIYSIELAYRNKPYLCIGEAAGGKALPKDVFQVSGKDYKPFIFALYNSSPFSCLFKDTGSINFESSIEDNVDVAKESHDHRKSNPTLNESFIGELPSDLIRQKARKSITGKRSGSLSDLFDIGKTASKARQYVTSSLGSLLGHPSSLSRPNSSGELDGLNFSVSNPKLTNASSFNSVTNCRSIGSSPLEMYGSNEAMAEQLEEFERQLSYEMPSYDGVDQFSLTHLTVPMLESAVEKYIQTDDPSFLLNTIRTVFTSSEALNNSFKLKEDCPYGPENLDLSAIKKAYKMMSAYFDVFQSPIQNSIEIMLSMLSRVKINPEDINQVLIIMEAPIFRKTRNHSLRQSFCNLLARLPENSKAMLASIISSCDANTFEKKLMGIYKDHFVLSLKPNQRFNSDLADIAETLAIFYQASQNAEERTGQTIIPNKTFYIPELSKLLDFRGEYESWQLQHEGAAGDSKLKTVLDFPFILDPSCKVHILHLDAVIQMRKEYQEAILHQARINQVRKYFREVNRPLNLSSAIRSAMCPFLVIEIRRSHLLEDTLAEIKLKQIDLKKPIKIKYVGGGEQGLDMGGLQKEFFQLICEAIFDPAYGMFTYSKETRTLWINGSSLDSDEEFELVGIILGLAIYNGIILDVKLPTVIYKKLQGYQCDLTDLIDAQPILGRGLQELLNYDGDDVEDVFCQTFQISTEVFGQNQVVDLVPGGADILVTNQNRDQFVRRYVKYLLVDSIAKQFKAFSWGFSKVCNSETLALFRPDEIELLVCGSPDLDFEALEASASYEDGYNINHRVVRVFWSIVHEMSPEHKKRLLHFITGSDRVPLKGLSHLPIVIQRNGTGESERLPTAMTCFNRLLLPPYPTREKLRDRLYVAIDNGKGFGLT